MRLITPVVLVLLGLLGAMALDRPAPRADVVIVNNADVFTLDPQRMSYIKDFRLAWALYEPLVIWDNEHDRIIPGAAEAWRISDDGLRYEFALAPEARWSNGDAVTAHDFVYSFQRLLLADTAADYSNLLFVIEGARAFFLWRGEQTGQFARGESAHETAAALWRATEQRFVETVGVRATDDHTLVITLDQPTAYFLDLLSFAVCCPVHRPTVEGWPHHIGSSRGVDHNNPPPMSDRTSIALNPTTGKIEQNHRWARAGTLVGNGPYVLAQWRYKRDIRLERNEHFHRPQRVRNESVSLLTIEDANTRVLAYESGQAHWLAEVGAGYEADMLADASRTNVHAVPAFGTDFYSFNCRPTLADGRVNPFADAAVRRAFAMAINKQAIVENVTRLNEPIATAFVPPGSIRGYETPQGLPFDVERARSELAAAGWIDRDGDGVVEDSDGLPFPTIDLLWTTGTPRYKWMSLELKAQWEKNLAVRIELRGTDTKFYKEDLKLGKFMIARGRWYGDYGDPTTFLDLCRSTDGNNDRGYNNPQVDRMLDDAAAEPDAQRRFGILQECERVLFQQEVPMLPICQLVQVYMFDETQLNGLSTHPRLVQYLWKLEPGASDPRDEAR